MTAREENPEQVEKRFFTKRRTILLVGLLIILVVGAAAVVSYFVFFKVNSVPDVMGLLESAAKKKIQDAGFRPESSCRYPNRIGTERVIEQDPKAGTKDKTIKTVRITVTDKAMESALLQARQAVGQANASLAEVQAMGIDTGDLVDPIKNAQAKLDGARSVADCTGQTDSACYWAGVVTNGCNSRKQAFAAQQERNRQIANCRAAMLAAVRAGSAPELSITISSISMNDACTSATGAAYGVFTSGPRAGSRTETLKVVAVCKGDTWVVTDFGTGI